MRNEALFFSSPRLELHTPFALRAKCCVRPAWLIQRLIYRLEQTSICTQLFAGHLVGFRPMRRKKNLHQMVTLIALFYSSTVPPDSLLFRHQKLFGYIV